MKYCMENPIVRVGHLYHRYTTQWAIQDVCFSIERTGIVGLLGSNGAGKSTIMNIICGVLKQTGGEVYIDGVNTLADPIAARKNIGFLPQKPPLYPDLTVDEYLRFSAEMRLVNAREIKIAVEEAEERCGITHFKSRLIRNLSGGYQQRVGIAQAILHRPKFVILDEPTNGLDPNQILEVRHLIQSIAQERTVMLSTHILSEVQASCDSIMMIEHGQVVFSGTVDEFDHNIELNVMYVSFDFPPLPDELTGIPGVSSAEMVNERGLRVWYDGDRDTVKRVVRESISRGWELMEIRAEKSSMEDVFAKLSGKKSGNYKTRES